MYEWTILTENSGMVTTTIICLLLPNARLSRATNLIYLTYWMYFNVHRVDSLFITIMNGTTTHLLLSFDLMN